MKIIVLFLICSTVFADEASLTLGLYQSETLRVPGLERVAVGSGKIVKTRVVPPDTILITAKAVGITTVRAWGAGKERVYQVQVLSPTQVTNAIEEQGKSTVKISLEFLEMNVVVSRGLGIQWPEAVRFGAQAVASGDLQTTGLNFVSAFQSTDAWIRHMIKEGWGRVLANPHLYVRLGEEASFHSGGEIPLLTVTDNFGRAFQKVEWKPYGLTVKVRPQSTDSMLIRSNVELEISELSQEISVQGFPGLTKRTLNTKIDSRESETVVLSGFLLQTDRRRSRGLPFLSKLPLLGSLFSTKDREAEEREILVAVTFSLASRAKNEKTMDDFRERFEHFEDRAP